MAIEILKQCQKEILDWPDEVREDLADAIARLERGHVSSMPLSRPMPSIGKGVHELRLKDRSGAYRVIYYLAGTSQFGSSMLLRKRLRRQLSKI
jgi:phage-related protein